MKMIIIIITVVLIEIGLTGCSDDTAVGKYSENASERLSATNKLEISECEH